MKKSITYLQLFEFVFHADQYAVDHPDNKLTAAIKKFLKQYQEIKENYDDLVDDIQLANCLTYASGDKKGGIITEETKTPTGNIIRTKIFSVEGQLAIKKAVKELLNQSVDMHVRLYPESPDDGIMETLSDKQKEVFSGFVIKEIAKNENPD